MKNGYAILPSILDDDELKTLQEACDTLLAEPPDDDKGGAAQNIGRGHDRRFLRHRHGDMPSLKNFILGDTMKSFVSNFIGDIFYQSAFS
jgi:hypothetical protein